MKRFSAGTGSPTETEPFDFGTLSRTQRAILAAIRVDGPGTEADLYSGVRAPKPESMQALRDDLHVLEDRALVRCEIQPNGRRIWGECMTRPVVGTCAPQFRKPAKRRRARTGYSEHDEAVAFWRMVTVHESGYPDLRMLFAVPNGGARSKATGGKLKAEGVRPGVSDYIAIVPRNGFHGLALELKTAKGVVSKEQNAFIAAARIAGYRAEIARGWAEAWEVVCSYFGIRRGDA